MRVKYTKYLLPCLIVMLVASCKKKSNLHVPQKASTTSKIEFYDVDNTEYASFSVEVRDSSTNEILASENLDKGESLSVELEHGTYDFSMTLYSPSEIALSRSSNCSLEFRSENTQSISRKIEKLRINVCSSSSSPEAFVIGGEDADEESSDDDGSKVGVKVNIADE